MLVIQHFRHCSEQKLARQGEVKEREKMCLLQLLLFCFTLMSPSVPADEKQTHSMRQLPAHFTLEMVLCR